VEASNNEESVYLLSGETGETLGPFKWYTEVLAWYKEGQVSGDQLVCNEFDELEQGWITLETKKLQEATSFSDNNTEKVFLLSGETGEPLGPYMWNDEVLAWYNEGQVSGDQLVCNEFDELEQGWITLETKMHSSTEVATESVQTAVSPEVGYNDEYVTSLLTQIEELQQLLLETQAKLDAAEVRAVAAEERANIAEQKARDSGGSVGAASAGGARPRGRGGVRPRGGARVPRPRGSRPRGPRGPRPPPLPSKSSSSRKPMNTSGGGGRGGLLAAIQKGKSLKKRKTGEKKKGTGGGGGGSGGLMAQISGGGFKLKSSKDRKLKEKPKKNSGGGGGMGGMMAEMKRKAELRRKRAAEKEQ
jgi:hypothetical protein